MNFIKFLLPLMIILLAGCKKDYYDEPSPVNSGTNINPTMFNDYIPNVLKGMNYEIDNLDEENKFVSAYKFIEYKNKEAKLYFDVKYADNKLETINYIFYKEKKYYIDNDKFPDEIKDVFKMDLQKFLTMSKGGSFPNR